jgi:hypothetical protein
MKKMRLKEEIDIWIWQKLMDTMKIEANTPDM